MSGFILYCPATWCDGLSSFAAGPTTRVHGRFLLLPDLLSVLLCSAKQQAETCADITIALRCKLFVHEPVEGFGELGVAAMAAGESGRKRISRVS